jgi:hypothetical protein
MGSVAVGAARVSGELWSEDNFIFEPFFATVSPHISQAEKFLAVVAGQMPLNFQLDV